MKQWNISGLQPHQAAVLTEVQALLGVEFGEQGLLLSVATDSEGPWVQSTPEGAVLHIHSQTQLARAAGLLAQGVLDGAPQKPAYRHLELMWDASRNAVPHFEGYKKLVRSLALMGYTGIQMYTEDLYELESYPYFGYLRGRYTAKDFAQMETYANLFGIELVPCIQTLAHLGQALRWPGIKECIDCNDILIVGEEKTYDLIEKMIATMAHSLKSRRINIGMDEAHMLGLGKYLDKNGYQDRVTLMLKHFNRVMEILRKYNYEPMMWSDMFFRLLSGGEYYAEDVELSPEARAQIPADITLLYWDYYSLDQEKYNKMMNSHKKMCNKVAFAGGAWTWVGFSPNNRYSLHVSELAHNACLKQGVDEVLITSWGDDGAETPVFDVLPSLQFWAECCYQPSSPKENLPARFATCTGGVWEDFLLLDSGNTLPNNPAPGICGATPTRYLVYQDVLLGMYDAHIPESYPAYFIKAAQQLEEAVGRNPRWAIYFETQASLCRLLALKATAGIALRRAYQNGDRAVLEQYATSTLSEIYARTQAFAQCFSTQWQEGFRIFGLEVIEQRLGGQLLRLRTAERRLQDYLSGKLTRLEELEQTILPLDGVETPEPHVLKYTFWKNIISGCVVSD